MFRLTLSVVRDSFNTKQFLFCSRNMTPSTVRNELVQDRRDKKVVSTLWTEKRKCSSEKNSDYAVLILSLKMANDSRNI
jgi:hypothetical protein